MCVCVCVCVCVCMCGVCVHGKWNCFFLTTDLLNVSIHNPLSYLTQHIHAHTHTHTYTHTHTHTQSPLFSSKEKREWFVGLFTHKYDITDITINFLNLLIQSPHVCMCVCLTIIIIVIIIIIIIIMLIIIILIIIITIIIIITNVLIIYVVAIS